MQNTKTALFRALLTLLRERDWDDIGVSEICVHANVARSTFYNHYAGKQDLLDDSFAALRENIVATARRSAARPDPFAVIDLAGEHALANRSAFAAMMRRRGSGPVRERFGTMIAELLMDRSLYPHACEEAKARFLAGAYVSLAVHLVTARGSGPKLVNEQFRKIAGPIMQTG